MALAWMVKELRHKQDLSRYELGNRAKMKDSHLYAIEGRRRPETTFRTMRQLVHGLTHKETMKPLSAEDRMRLMGALHADREVVNIERYAIYFLWAMGQPTVVRQVLTDLRAAGYEAVDELDAELQPADIDGFGVFELLAEDERFAEVRRALADLVVDRAEINLRAGTIQLFPGALGSQLLREAGVTGREESGSSPGAPVVEFRLERGGE